MKSTIDISHASGSDEEVEWSSAEKSGLFSCLVNQHDEIPSFGPGGHFEFRPTWPIDQMCCLERSAFLFPRITKVLKTNRMVCLGIPERAKEALDPI
jgi:hypothetical protein